MGAREYKNGLVAQRYPQKKIFLGEKEHHPCITKAKLLNAQNKILSTKKASSCLREVGASGSNPDESIKHFMARRSRKTSGFSDYRRVHTFKVPIIFQNFTLQLSNWYLLGVGHENVRWIPKEQIEWDS